MSVRTLPAAKQVVVASSIDTRIGFTGRRIDPETRLMYYRNRYYSPELGGGVNGGGLGIPIIRLYSKNLHRTGVLVISAFLLFLRSGSGKAHLGACLMSQERFNLENRLMAARCPGTDLRYWTPDDIRDQRCPSCGFEIEIWKDEPVRTCPKCKAEIRNLALDLSCAKWCLYAEECPGVQAARRGQQNG